MIAAGTTVSEPRESGLTAASLTLSHLSGIYSVLTMPFVLTALMKSFELSEATAGRLVSLHLICMAGGSVLVTWSLRPGRSVRPILAFTAISIALANAASALFHWPLVAGAGRVVTGLAEGAAMASTAAAVCATANQHRVFSLIAMVTSVVAILALIVAPFFATAVGPDGIFWLLALTPLTVLPFLGRIPIIATNPVPSSIVVSRGALFRSAPILVAYFLLWAGAGGMWVYAERIGTARGLTPSQLSFWLSIGQITGLLGPLAAVWIPPRVGLRVSVAAGGLGLAIAVVFFVFGAQPWTYGMGGALGSFWLTFVTPCFRSRMAGLDPSGRTVSLSTGFYTMGFAAAPLVISSISQEGRGYAAAGLFCVTCYIGSAFLSAARK